MCAVSKLTYKFTVGRLQLKLASDVIVVVDE